MLSPYASVWGKYNLDNRYFGDPPLIFKCLKLRRPEVLSYLPGLTPDQLDD